MNIVDYLLHKAHESLIPCTYMTISRTSEYFVERHYTHIDDNI